MATVNINNVDVSNYLGVLSVPSVLLVVEENSHEYGSILTPSMAGIRQFIAHHLPQNLINKVS